MSQILPHSETAPAPSRTETNCSKLKVVIVDDHPVTRQGLRALIDAQSNLRVCGEAESAPEAMTLVESLQPDLAILDVSLKATNGLELTRSLKMRSPHLPILVVSMHDEVLLAERALRAGAMGYVMKQEAGEKVVTALQHLLRGEIYLSSRVKAQMVRRVAGKKREGAVFAMDLLTDREREVFQRMGEGHSTREIAQQLGLSSKTVDTHREHLKLKLGIGTGAELVRHAIQWVRMVATFEPAAFAQ